MCFLFADEALATAIDEKGYSPHTVEGRRPSEPFLVYLSVGRLERRLCVIEVYFSLVETFRTLSNGIAEGGLDCRLSVTPFGRVLGLL